jgi:hypothetical protein
MTPNAKGKGAKREVNTVKFWLDPAIRSKNKISNYNIFEYQFPGKQDLIRENGLQIWTQHCQITLEQGHPTFGPKTFLCGSNWIQNLMKNRYFDHFSLGFCQKVAQIMGKKLIRSPETNLGWTPLL